MEWASFCRVLEGERLPAAIVDLDALDRNVARLAQRVEKAGKTLRVASKSVRHVGLLRRILAAGGATFRGLLCFTLEEAVFLGDQGFDDLIVAYPSVQSKALLEIAERVQRGANLRLVADAPAHLEAYASAARLVGTRIPVLLDLDVAFDALHGRVHLGALRSPVRSAAAIAELARAAKRIDGIDVVGMLAYEAHVAGLPDANPFTRALNPMRRALKRVAVPKVAELRRAAVDALRAEGIAVEIVNGGGTGSIESTLCESAVTEITAGSGFVCSHLFDYYRGNELEPAAFFALEVSRIPERGVITCLGGGYVASGEPGWDRLPLPWQPRGLRYVGIEGAGEVQTPLRVPPDAPPIAIGDPIVFRHAKAGELAERFETYLLVRGGRVVAREPTYRGMGKAFL